MPDTRTANFQCELISGMQVEGHVARKRGQAAMTDETYDAHGRPMGRIITLNEFARAAFARRWLILAMAMAGALLAIAVSFLMTPVYRAEVLMAPVTDDRTTAGLASALGQLGALIPGMDLETGGNIAAAKALLSSRILTDSFISEANLMPILFADRWDSEGQRWAVDADDVPTAADGFNLFDTEIRRFIEDPRTGLLTLQIDWTDRTEAATWANLLVTRANQALRTKAIDDAKRSIAYLNQELAKATILELQQSIYHLIETQIQTIMLANTREDYAFDVIDPAVIPDEDDFVTPNRRLLAALGLIGGMALGILIAWARLVRDPDAAVRARHTPD